MREKVCLLRDLTKLKKKKNTVKTEKTITDIPK